MAVSNTMVQTKSSHQQTWNFKLMFTNHGKEDGICPLKRDSKAQNKDQISIVSTCKNTYRLVGATDLWLAATGTIAGSYSFGILFFLSKVSCTNSHVNLKIFITISCSYSCYSWQIVLAYNCNKTQKYHVPTPTYFQFFL
jgi:hypothetical protein